MNKTVSIADLKTDQKIAGEAFVLKEFETKQSRVGKSYYNLKLGDKTGDILGKVWTENLSNCERGLAIGDIISASGYIQEYAGKPQFIVESMKKLIDAAPEEFLPVTSRDRSRMKQDLEDEITKIKNPYLKKLLDAYWPNPDNRDKFTNFPAAEYVHHAYVGGLLEHTWEMLKLSKPFFEIYPGLDWNLFFTGLFFHDIGKLEEYDIVGAAIVRTTPGKLVGHITQGIVLLHEMIEEIPDFPKSLRDKLFHLIISHQGSLEYGSPVVPMTLEALILSFVDTNSADMNQAIKHIEKGLHTGEEFTEYHKWLKRSFYQGDLINHSSDVD
ncbi:hypothetical protein A2982_01690 [candidate division WWE3 bacterium RIFCSPLOWO2_01_FULL_39_13]|uniref:HD domain-containing protein n=1 Tax=candidate division WWE3 bacterium RIFCSPLOWO2_01_FULL_39_13 TaxID=1802624 RepID=A0A1F4V4S1_UNCKA|nr:MAG: hypothetical protein A2982_01690 [candidate division WWE3 bacterium RIFCSPLOWO2_01_FULL_39_13]